MLIYSDNSIKIEVDNFVWTTEEENIVIVENTYPKSVDCYELERKVSCKINGDI